MDVHTTVPIGAEDAILWEWPDGKQLTGPQLVEVELPEPVEGLSPWPLRLGIALGDDQRYVVTYLAIRADATAHEAGVLRAPLAMARVMPAADLPPITARGINDISLPAIVRQALYKKFTVRYRNAVGDLVEGPAPDYEPDVIYMRAQAMGDDPTKAVANQLGISVGAAAQRIARARKQGLIPPTRRGAR